MPNNIAPVFPFDPTGMLVSNLITNEQQILTKVNGIDYHFLIPINGPYFEDTLVVTITDPATNVTTTLTSGIDYYSSHWFISASRACAKNVYGSISFLDLMLNGVITLRYQTIGGNWTIDSSTLASTLADVLHNPRITSWEEVTNYPIAFPPIPHQWDLVDMVGMSDVTAGINDIANIMSTEVATNITVTNSLNNVVSLLNAEVARATASEKDLKDLINAEVSRALAAEVVLAVGISNKQSEDETFFTGSNSGSKYYMNNKVVSSEDVSEDVLFFMNT